MTDNFSDIFIRDLMTRDVVVVNENEPIERIFELFDTYHFNSYPVVNNDGELVGIIDQDIMLEIMMFHRIPRIKYTHIAAVRSLGDRAREIMIPHPISISPDAKLDDAVDMMLKHHVNRICVVDSNKLVGIISKKNIINEIYQRKEVD